MPSIEIYTTPICGFCHRAKSLLRQKGVSFVEIDLFDTPGKRSEMISRAGAAERCRRYSSARTMLAGVTTSTHWSVAVSLMLCWRADAYRSVATLRKR